MQQLLIYLLKVTIISAVLLLYYFTGLRNRRFHYYNRFYMLFSVALSIVLPLLHLDWFSFSNTSANTIKMYRIIYSGELEDVVVQNSSLFNIERISFILFVLLSAFLLLRLIISIKKIYKIKRTYPVNKLSAFDFIQTDLSSAPFSFFNNIFWRNDISIETNEGRQILEHEITHIKQKHSLDKLLMQLTLCFYWINPFFWIIRKELYLIHEFIADEHAVTDSNAAAFAQLLLTTSFGKFDFLPAQSVFYSSIKRRILMLTTSKKTQFSYLRRIMALPLIAVMVCLSAFTIKQTSNTHTYKIVAAKPFKLVVDAGHGGQDDGTVSNDMTEKNIALQIAKAIKDLSSQYNIDVVLTRSADVYMSPAEKSNFANAQTADAFISVHINAADKEHINNSGIEVVLSKKNTTELDKSQVLGSAIIQNLQNNFKVAPALLQRQIGIWVLDKSNIPSALIECGYMTNADDVAVLKDDNKIELMARNILQGVAMYANNKVDKTNLYQIKDRSNDTNASAKPNLMLHKQPEPLYVLDGKIVSKEVLGRSVLEPDFNMSANVLKDKAAIDKYGDKGKNGVVEITSKKDKGVNVQNNVSGFSNTIDTSTKPIFTQAQKEPQFPGGNEGWIKFLENNLNANVPAKRHAPKGNYTVTLFFLIDETGKVSDVKALKDPGYGTAKEAVRVIAKGPDWIPAEQNGQKVVYRQKQNITFQVSAM